MVCTYHAVRTRPGVSETKEEGENRTRVVSGFCPFYLSCMNGLGDVVATAWPLTEFITVYSR